MSSLVDQVRAYTSARTQDSSVQVPMRASEAGWLAAAVFVVDLATTVYLAYGVRYVNGDALSRVAEAYYVFFSRDPHLAAIGMVWNPLPSLLVLPLVLIKPFVPSLVTRGVVEGFLTALFGAIGAVQLAGILAGFRIPKLWRIAVVALYALNPLILLYSANGMSDIMLMTPYLGALNGLFRYTEQRSLKGLVAAGLWIAVGFGSRYESVPFALFVAMGLVVGLWRIRPLREIQSAGILLLAPLAYAGAVWMYFNWLIMKNPLYFVNSPYGNAAQTGTGAGLGPVLYAARHHLLPTLGYAADFLLLFWPVALGLVGAVYWSRGRFKDARAPILVGALIGAVALEVSLVYIGLLAHWDRYFMSYIPIGFVMIAFATSKLMAARPHRKAWLLGGMVAVLLAGNIGTWAALKVPMLGHPDGKVLQDVVTMTPVGVNTSYGYQRSQVASYINRHPHLLVLADTFNAFKIVLQVDNPKQFVITSDQNFESILHNPVGRVNAILVPKPIFTGALDAVNQTYPRMWEGKVRWTYLMASFHDISSFRLYGVRPTAP